MKRAQLNCSSQTNGCHHADSAHLHMHSVVCIPFPTMPCISLTSDTASVSRWLFSFASLDQTSTSTVDLLLRPPFCWAARRHVGWTASPFDPSAAAVHVFSQMHVCSQRGDIRRRRFETLQWTMGNVNKRNNASLNTAERILPHAVQVNKANEGLTLYESSIAAKDTCI